ncbi:MAG: amidohydrolase family protein [Halobacteriales archaeon]|nr:amidohydrolase family protein [Halobacteriales archaeon]
MPRIVDAHTHPPVPAFLRDSGGAYVEAARAHFRIPLVPASMADMVRHYEGLGIGHAVLLGWDAERNTGLPPVPNDVVAQAVQEHGGFFTGFAGIDPLRGKALDELERCARLGLRGVKLHPSAQGFALDDPRCARFWRRCEDLGMLLLVHTGTTGLGAGAPGGLGMELALSRPLALDAIAARHPSLQLIAAHAGWPWHEELLAIALHKPNVHLDISGWLPRYLPKVVWDHANGPLRTKVLFGSDYPFVQPERILDGLKDVLKPEALDAVLGGNATRLLGLPA